MTDQLINPIKTIQTDKVEAPKKKRISKGEATHNRRTKQENRNPSPLHK